MSNLKKFKVIPDVPEKLKCLYEIAYNMWLTWNPDAVKLFTRMDAHLWASLRQNPVQLLGKINQERLDELAGEEGFIVEVERVYKRLADYLSPFKASGEPGSCRIGYFSLEYGLAESLPNYSGGLGILSGDHIKSSSDLRLNLTGVGLLYQTGYFQQYLNQDGWQQEFYKANDFHNMRVVEETAEDGSPLEVQLALPTGDIFLKAWKLAVGRIDIYFMDANVEKNSERDRKLTAQLYGGDKEMRLRQEIILGIGGVRLLEKLGKRIEVVHMNEGHSAFAAFERAGLLMKKYSLDFAEAIEVVRKSGVFTTHTPVPAGNDVFEPDLIKRYFKGYVEEWGISLEDFLKFGRVQLNNQAENFSMTVAAIKNSTYVNGVSRLHSEVSRQMWKDIWPGVPGEHIPIEAITNGIHIPSWISSEMGELLGRYLGENWQKKQDSKALWEKIHSIPDPELWSVHEARRRKLVTFVREKLEKQAIKKGLSRSIINACREALNPEALTIGFARRFTTYKRGDLVIKDGDRLLRILNDSRRPVQIIFAGKAHPQDFEGKKIIERIIHFINNHGLAGKVVFIENYDIEVARFLVQGVDVWLNNPLRPLEACGTSGMKAAANAVLNLSVLDGWWDEAYRHSNGWAIGNGEVYEDKNYQDEVESKAIYSILENDIIPLFYERDASALPREWIKMMKDSFVSIVSYYNTHRMVKDYHDRFYKKARGNYESFSVDHFTAARDFLKWKNKVKENFPSIRIEKIELDETKIYKINDELRVEVEVFLGYMGPPDVRVDIYYGNLSGENGLTNPEIEQLKEVKPVGNGTFLFSGGHVCKRTGDFGFKVRITPHHPLMVNPYELDLVKWS